MTSICTSGTMLPVKVQEYCTMDSTIIPCGDYSDYILPPLDPGTVRKLNFTNVLAQNRLAIYRSQLQKEKEEAKMRFFVRKQAFVRSSIVLQEHKTDKILASKMKSKLICRKPKETLHEENMPSSNTLSKDDLRNDTRTTKENYLNISDHISPPLRPPYFLPPLYKNIIMDLKHAKAQKERQGIYWKMNEIKLEDLQSCRYLRIAGRAEVMIDLRRNDDSY